MADMQYTLIEKQIVYSGSKVRLELHNLRGPQGQRIQREVVAHRGAVAIVPLLDARTVLLIRNYRYAIDQALLELPAGTLEKGEEPAACAARELEEETGYQSGRLQLLGSFYTSPGVLTEKMYLFAAYDLRRTASALEEGEEIELAPMGIEQALEMIGDGRIIDGKTIAGLLFHQRLGPSVNTAQTQSQT